MLKSLLKNMKSFVFILALILCEVMTVIFLDGIVCNRKFSFFVGITGIVVFSSLTVVVMAKLLKLLGL